MGQSTNDALQLLNSLSNSEIDELLNNLQNPKKQTKPTKNGVSNHRENAKRWAAKQSKSAQEIGRPPDLADELIETRKRCDDSLLEHLRTCYPNAFPLEFSPDHLELIHQLEQAATVGLLKAVAMPRGSGKTTIMLRCMLWALLTAKRRFGVLVAATNQAAQGLLESAKMELLYNETLSAIYPAETWSFRCLNGESRLATGQRYNGEKTSVEWKQDRIRWGMIDESVCSGSVLSVVGLTGNIRGQQATLSTGQIIRPDIVGIDDPQTKESAKSPSQCKDRFNLIVGDVLGMSGAQQMIAGVCTGTVIYKNDLVDRMLDRSQCPVWKGSKCQMVYEWGTGGELWANYRSKLETELSEGGTGEIANQYVRENFEEMHAGAKVGWEQRKSQNELSALHHAWNLRIRDEETFFAEYQNEPLGEAIETPFEIDPVELINRTNGFERDAIPPDCSKIVAFVDVQLDVLFYVVTAWEIGGRCHVIDYGTFPDQRRLYFNKRQISVNLRKATKQRDSLSAIYAGLSQLTSTLAGREYVKSLAGGRQQIMRIDRFGVDAGWGQATETIRKFCLQSSVTGKIHPTHGHFIGADSRPWHLWKHSKSDLLGRRCKMSPPPAGQRGVGSLIVDTNFWKSFAAERLVCSPNSEKAILLYEGTKGRHRMFADHCGSEEPEVVTGKIGNKVVEWKQRKSNLDNDFFDCLVGCCVIGSIEGVADEFEQTKTNTEKRVQRKRRKYGVRKIE